MQSFELYDSNCQNLDKFRLSSLGFAVLGFRFRVGDFAQGVGLRVSRARGLGLRV